MMSEQREYLYTDDEDDIDDTVSFQFKLSRTDSTNIDESVIEDSSDPDVVSSSNDESKDLSQQRGSSCSKTINKNQKRPSNHPSITFSPQNTVVNSRNTSEFTNKQSSVGLAKQRGSSVSKTPINNQRSTLNNTLTTPRPQKPIINSDSEGETPKTISHRLAKKTSKPVIESDSEDDSFIHQRKPRPIIQSDSESDEGQRKAEQTDDSDSEVILVNKTKEPTVLIESDLSSFSSAEEQEKNSDDKNNRFNGQSKNEVGQSKTEVGQSEHQDKLLNVSAKLESTRLQTAAAPSPIISSHTKRSLNRSVDTPRIIKHLKESKTPVNSRDSFMPKFQSTILHDSLGEDQDSDVIDISSEEELHPSRENKLPGPSSKTIQPPISAHFKPTKPTLAPAGEIKKEVTSNETIMVSRQVYQQQQIRVNQFQSDLKKAVNVLRTVKLDLLPDKGESIRVKHQVLEKALVDEVKKLSKMIVNTGDTLLHNRPIDTKNSNVKILTWKEIEAKAAAVQPKTFGKQAMSTYNAQKAVTMDKLHQLHGSLKTCPKETDLAKDPKGLKVELMHHQKHALAWLMWREKQQPSGGILADDMGLGKTLTMISLLLKTREVENDESEDSDSENTPARSTETDGGTLVVCPASLINQWSSELERRTKRGLASYEMYHGPKRETKPKRLAEHDMVITTYAIVNNENEKNGAVFRVRWRRIVLDEAHQIRNHKSQTSVAVCKLSAKSRWALTGTPVHNKELDMYALLKFLRCTPFDDLQVWKRWVSDRSTGGQERLHTVISSLMLRRTKAELIEKGTMTVLPERKWELIPVQLNKSELDVYNRILIFSRTLFAQFLHQRAEKRQDGIDLKYNDQGEQNNAPNQEYFMMREKLLRLNKVKTIKQHEILVLLLRLRQICCHPSLITGMLHEDMENLGDEEDEESETHQELDLLDQLNKLALDEDKYDSATAQREVEVPEEGAGLKEATKGWLNPNHPIFAKDRASSKIEAVIEVLKDKVLPTDDKAIIVSQWPSYLDLIAYHLKHNHVKFDKLDGKVPVPKRMEMVDCFNDPNNRLKVLLLSLTAGGVGLNLVGGNHLFLLDLHWNPQLENQAQDRIYRVGQKKPVYVYKFLATDTIEKRILDLQQKKLNIAEAMLTGSKQAIANKLTLEDLKMLFEM